MAHDLKKKSRTSDVLILENVDFSSLLLCDRVIAGLTKAGFKKPSPIQLEAIPCGRFGKDLWVQAKSGTGKTLVFVIVALEMLLHKLFRPQVLILVPTREIAAQIQSVIRKVGSSFHKLKSEIFIGGLPVADDIKKAFDCQIAVGTPGRIKQLIDIKALPTSAIRLIVFDEADELLEYSLHEDIEKIFNTLPEEKQVIATSATYPQKLKRNLLKFFREPHIARLDLNRLALLGIVHYAKIVEPSSMSLKQYDLRLAALKPILKTVKFAQCLVYCDGILKVETLYRAIKKWGFSANFISSMRSQTDRLKAIECLKRFKCKVLVSSDVTARGIDAENVDLVINFDLTRCLETYVHRSGRAGRYGTTGVTISILDPFEFQFLKTFEDAAHFKTYVLPDPLPVDLIQNPPFDKYVFEIPDKENEQEEKPISFAEQQPNGSYNRNNKGKKFSVSLTHVQDNSELSRNGNLETSTICDDTNNSSQSLEVKSDSICQTKDLTTDSQDLNFDVSSPKVCNIISSVINECKESNITISLPLKNVCVVNETIKVSDVESKVFAVQSDDGHERTSPDANLMSPVCSVDETDLDVHNNEFSKVVEKFTNDYEVNRNTKHTNVLSDEEPLKEDKKSLECIQDNSEISMNGNLEPSTILNDTTESSKSLEIKSYSVCQSKGSVNQHLNSEVSSPKVSRIVSSVLIEELDANISLPLENLCTVNESIEISDVNSKMSVIESNDDQDIKSTFPDVSVKSLIYSADKIDLDVHNKELVKVVETFVNNYEANQNSKSTNALSNKESLMSESFETDTMLISKDLNSKRFHYYYKVCKLFLDENACSNSENKIQESLDETHKENEFCTNKAFLENANDEEILKKSQNMEKEHHFIRTSENLKEMSENSITENDSIPNYDDNHDICEISSDKITQYCDKYKVTTLFDKSAVDMPPKYSLNSDDESSEKSVFQSDGKVGGENINCSSEDSESESSSDTSGLSSTSLGFSSLLSSSSEDSDGSETSFSSSSEKKLVSGNKKVPFHSNHTHSHSRLSAHDRSQQLSCSTSDNTYSKQHQSSHLYVYQQPHFPRYSGIDQNTYNSENFSVCNHPHKSSSSVCKKCRFRKTYDSVLKKHQPSCTLGFKKQHSPLCVKPSEQRCHSCIAYQQPYFPQCLGTHQDSFNPQHFPVTHCLHKSLSSECKKYRSRKEYLVHKKNQSSCASGFKEQHSPLYVKRSEQRCHSYNAYQQPYFPQRSSTNQDSYNYQNFPVSHYLHKSLSSECKKYRSGNEYFSVHKKNQSSCASGINELHSFSNVQPTEHRAHPYNANVVCNQRELCALWYEIFHNQWLHIHRLSYSTT